MYRDNKNLLNTLWNLRVVPRWAVVPTLQQQNVAEHSYMVANISMWVVDNFILNAPKSLQLDVVRHALQHDWEESFTGDIPSPVKRSIQTTISTDNFEQAKGFGCHEYLESKELTMAIVKCADTLDALLFMWQEQRMGNSHPKILEALTSQIRRNWASIAPVTERELGSDEFLSAFMGATIDLPIPILGGSVNAN